VKEKVPEPAKAMAKEKAKIAHAKTVKEQLRAKVLVPAKAKVLVLEKEPIPLLMKAKVRFLTKAKKLLLAKAPVLVLEKIAVAVRNPVPTRWNRQRVLNRMLQPLVQLREQLLEWVLEVRALMVRTW
jgi:hypothetical protein